MIRGKWVFLHCVLKYPTQVSPALYGENPEHISAIDHQWKTGTKQSQSMHDINNGTRLWLMGSTTKLITSVNCDFLFYFAFSWQISKVPKMPRIRIQVETTKQYFKYSVKQDVQIFYSNSCVWNVNIVRDLPSSNTSLMRVEEDMEKKHQYSIPFATIRLTAFFVNKLSIY